MEVLLTVLKRDQAITDLEEAIVAKKKWRAVDAKIENAVMT